MTTPDLRLRPLTAEDEPEVLRAHAVMRADDFSFLLFHDLREPWADYLARLEANRRGAAIGQMTVPSSFLLATVADQIVGRVSVRHDLDEWLARQGGHIGYCVLPEHRRRGYATEMLRQALIVARSVGVGRALVTCDDTNLASARTIKACGGTLESVVQLPDRDEALRRYWID